MINWGILGLGRMGVTFADSIVELSNSKLIAVGSNSNKKYRDYKIFSYDEVLKNENIDAIYIATLNNSHIDLIKKACVSKKKILCEKPASMKFGQAIIFNPFVMHGNNPFRSEFARIAINVRFQSLTTPLLEKNSDYLKYYEFSN